MKWKKLIDPHELTYKKERKDQTATDRKATQHARVAVRVASRALANINREQHSHIVKGGRLGIIATWQGQDPEVYRIAADRLSEEGVKAKVERVLKKEWMAPLPPQLIHIADILTVTEVNGREIPSEDHPVLAMARGAENFAVQQLYPPTPER